MDADRLLPALAAGLVVGLVIFALLLTQRRRQRPDFVGRVKADAYLAMVRALLLAIVGLLLLLGGVTAGRVPYAETVQRVAIALIGIGGVAFVARAALYVLRIKPQLDGLPAPVAPVAPVVGARDVWRDEQ